MTAHRILIFLLAGLIAGWSGVGANAAVTSSGDSSSDSGSFTDADNPAKPVPHKSKHHKKSTASTTAKNKDKTAQSGAGTNASASGVATSGPADATTGTDKEKTAATRSSHKKKMAKNGSGKKTKTANAGGAAIEPTGTATLLPGANPETKTGTTQASVKEVASTHGSKHKHSHRHGASATTETAATTEKATAPAITPIVTAPTNTVIATASAPLTVTKSASGTGSEISISAPPAAVAPAGAGPEVDTGLPVARHSGNNATDPMTGSVRYQVASTFPITSTMTTSMGSFSDRHVKTPLDDFNFTNFTRHVRNVYPWKYNIFTTIFWIGEGATDISSTTNVASAWDADWRYNNGGTDNPNDRDYYASGGHVSRVNPFYVALPFNDLAFPEKARRWLPSGWYRAPRDGKQVSACQHRWVEIKNSAGKICYAQWEDVGPLRYDHAEYVFGDESPDTETSKGVDRAGLDVSPAVATYLNFGDKSAVTRWRFVDDADVQSGLWLKYDEEAVLFNAMHQIKDDPVHILPIQRATAPIENDADEDGNKRRIGSAKG